MRTFFTILPVFLALNFVTAEAENKLSSLDAAVTSSSFDGFNLGTRTSGGSFKTPSADDDLLDASSTALREAAASATEQHPRETPVQNNMPKMTNEAGLPKPVASMGLAMGIGMAVVLL